MQLTEALEYLIETVDDLNIQYEPTSYLNPTSQEDTVYIGSNKPESVGISYYHEGTEYESVTEYLYFVDQEKLPLDRSLEELRFIIDDLSPDSCLGFILFCTRLLGVPADDFPEDWIEYVNKWEQGDVKTTGEPFESWGCLHSALAHAHVTVQEVMDEHGNHMTIIDSQNYISGFLACVQFALDLLLEEVLPYEIPELDHIEEYQRAIGFVRVEYQKYLQALNHATVIQLELPIRNSNRTLLVDAFIATENTYIGLLKSFLSNDEERTWLESGFSFMAIHRPELRGTGSDIVISVDPNMNIHLEDLWNRLEELENEKWAGHRPCDQPRYPERSEANQPWYDDRGRYTLLAAPQRIDPYTYGSKLEWADIVSAIWELYNPANSLTVRPYLEDGSIGETKMIYQCDPLIVDEQTQKRLTAVKWDSLSPQQSLVTSPSMKRYLAVCASGSFEGEVPPIHPLPNEVSFDFIELSCGFAIVHYNGVLILDDWNNDPLDFPLYTKEFQHLLERVRAITDIHAEITERVTEIKLKLEEKESLSGAEILTLNNWIAKQKMKLRHTILATMPSSIDYNLQKFRTTIEKRWGLSHQLEDLYKSVTEIENIIKNYSEARINRLISFISIYGFPLALFSGLFEFIFEDVSSPKWFGVHWVGLGTFLFLSFSSIWYIRFLLKNRK